MLLSVLSVELSKKERRPYNKIPLSPKAKYVLARFAIRFQEQTCRHERGELAALFGMSKGRLSDALHELVERELLLSHPQREGRGRPRNHYSVSPGTWQLLQSAQNSDMEAGDFHWAAIERVMTAAPATNARQEQGQGAESLPLEARLLLCALLCHADRHGVVRKLSSIDLYRFTGLKSDALKDHLQSFVNLELIRAWIPGVTSQALFGKAKSVYYLNLQHSLFESCYPLAGIMIFGWVQRWENAERLHSWLLEGLKPQAVSKPPSDEDLVARAVSLPEHRRIIPALQTRLELYASWLLSNCWGALNARDRSCPSALEVIIKRDFVDVRKKAKTELASVADILVRVIYAHARSLARETQRYLLRVSESEKGPTIAYEMHEYLILPHAPPQKRWEGRSAHQWTRTVLIVPKGTFAWHGCYNEMTTTLYNHESEIPLPKRYLYGLLTKPADKAVASSKS